MSGENTSRRSLIRSALASGMFWLTRDGSPRKDPPVQPGNPIVGGTVLRIPAIQSPNFVSGSTGWAINADGTAEFNGLTLHGTIVLGTGSNNVMIFDFSRRAIFVYDNAGNLAESISPTAGTDALGHPYLAGIASYDPTGSEVELQINGALIQFVLTGVTNTGFPGAVQQSNPTSNVNDQPTTSLISASTNANGDSATIELLGRNESGTLAPSIILGAAQATPADINVAIEGIAKYKPASGVIETWHALPLAPNWANQGAPFGDAKYKRMPDGTVRLTGAIAWGAAASNAPVQVWTALPAAYQPTSRKRCITMSMPIDTVTPQVESIDVRTDGSGWITSFANGTGPVSPITLDIISYPIDG